MVKYFSLGMLIYLVGVLGLFVVRKNLILVIMCIELLLLAINLNFIFFSVYLNDIVGQMFSVYILTVAAAESSIGLAILVIYYRLNGTIIIDSVSRLKG